MWRAVSVGRSFVPQVVASLSSWKAEWLARLIVHNYPHKPAAPCQWSVFFGALLYLLIWYVTCLESVMTKLTISHLRGGVVCLCFDLHISLARFLFVSPGVVWSRLNVRKRRMTYHIGTERFLFLALQGKTQYQNPYFAPGCLSGHFISVSHRTPMILITLHQIICWRIGGRYCPWSILVSTLLLSGLLWDLDFYSFYFWSVQWKKNFAMSGENLIPHSRHEVTCCLCDLHQNCFNQSLSSLTCRGLSGTGTRRPSFRTSCPTLWGHASCDSSLLTGTPVAGWASGWRCTGAPTVSISLQLIPWYQSLHSNPL